MRLARAGSATEMSANPQTDARLPSWLQPALDSVTQMYREHRLPHALIVNCPLGWGESHLASVVATQLLNVQTTTRAAHLAHPDLHWLQREAGSLLYKVAQIRGAVSFMQRTASDGGHKVIVVPDAHQMNDEGANTLLKSLEEPPPGGIWLLLCPDLGQLLATIRSRCQILSIRPTPDWVTADFVQDLLREADAEKRWLADAPALAMLDFEFGGAPERVAQALSLEEEPLWPALAGLLDQPELIGSISQAWQPRPLAELLSSWARYVHSIVSDQRPTFMQVPAIDPRARRKWFEFAEELTRSRALAARHSGINSRLVLDRLLGKWVALFDQKSI